MTVEGLVYPDTLQILTDLLDGEEHLGKPVTVAWYLEVMEGNPSALKGPFPLLHILPPRGTEGFLDKVDRVTLELYVEEGRASQVLESIKASIVGTDIETPSGYLDAVRVVTAPEDVPYQSDTLSLARASFDITTRPVN